jgi:hypothetical protein
MVREVWRRKAASGLLLAPRAGGSVLGNRIAGGTPSVKCRKCVDVSIKLKGQIGGEGSVYTAVRYLGHQSTELRGAGES